MAVNQWFLAFTDPAMVSLVTRYIMIFIINNMIMIFITMILLFYIIYTHTHTHTRAHKICVAG